MYRMRSFTFLELDPQTFDAFSARHPQGNFQQTSAMGTERAERGVDVQYLGVEEAGELVAATQLELHHGGISSSFAQIHDGPLVDFHDRELVEFLFKNIRERAKAAGAAQLEMTPEAPYQIRDTEGRPLPAPGSDEPWPRAVPAGAPAGPDDEAVEVLKGLGFEHAGFNLGYTDVPRWRYVKSLEGIAGEKELIASYTKNTKRNVRIAQTSGVKVERASREDLATFHDICELSCEKQGFDNRELDYFQLLFDTLGENAEFNIAYIDSREYLASWEQKRDEFAAEVERLERSLKTARTPEKVEKKLKDVRSKHGASLKRVETARGYIEEDGERIPAAAALFIWHPRECVYLFSGSDPKYAKFYAATAIQHHMMMECLERGCMQYNFYGINGVFDDPADPGRGLLEFKQGFGGYVQELMGEFTLPVKPALFAAKKLAHKVLGR